MINKLYIDTRDNQKTIVGLNNKRLEKATGPDKSQQILVLIDEILKKNKTKLEALTEITVETGPGSFTGIRVGITVAQTLSWTLKIPLNGQKPGEPVEPKYD